MSRVPRSELLREIETLRARLAQLEGGERSEHAIDQGELRVLRRLELAVRGTSDGLFYWEPDPAAEWWSPRMRDLLGDFGHELRANFESVRQMLHPDDVEKTLRALRQHLRDRKPYRVEYRLRTRHAGYRWFLARGVAEWDEEGRPLRMAGALQDVTERKAVEDALRREKELSESLIGSSRDGILAFDRELRYTIWNPAMEQISGVGQSMTVGRVAVEVFPFLRETGEEQFMREALAGKTMITRDRSYVIPETDREGFFEGYYSPLRNESGEIIGGLGIVRDITARKEAERRHEELEVQLRQSQKMEAIGQLAGGIAHDFNNLLTSILGNTQMLLPRLDEGLAGLSIENLRFGLKQIQDAGERAALLTQQLLAFSRKQVMKPELLDLGEVIAGIEGLLRSLLREDIQLFIEVAPDTRSIRAGASQLEQVLVNLVVNGRDAMPSGGTLRIAVSNVEDAESLKQTGPQVRLSVSDTGTGIDDLLIGRIFEPFFTTKERGKGTGLGLSTVYGVVTQLGGFIQVESEPGNGAAFHLQFPSVVDAAPTSVESAPSRAAVRPAQGEVVLVCEDSHSVRRVVCEILESAGYRVFEAADGREALRLAAEIEGGVDLLVSDVILPGMSGKELADRMARRDSGIRVLLTSGYADDVLGDTFVRSARRDFIQKPFSPSVFLRSVRDLLDAS